MVRYIWLAKQMDPNSPLLNGTNERRKGEDNSMCFDYLEPDYMYHLTNRLPKKLSYKIISHGK